MRPVSIWLQQVQSTAMLFSVDPATGLNAHFYTRRTPQRLPLVPHPSPVDDLKLVSLVWGHATDPAAKRGDHPPGGGGGGGHPPGRPGNQKGSHKKGKATDQKCFRCGNANHLAPECKFDGTCDHCKKKGHKSIVCKAKKSQTPTARVVFADEADEDEVSVRFSRVETIPEASPYPSLSLPHPPRDDGWSGVPGLTHGADDEILGRGMTSRYTLLGTAGWTVLANERCMGDMGIQGDILLLDGHVPIKQIGASGHTYVASPVTETDFLQWGMTSRHTPCRQ